MKLHICLEQTRYWTSIMYRAIAHLRLKHKCPIYMLKRPIATHCERILSFTTLINVSHWRGVAVNKLNTCSLFCAEMDEPFLVLAIVQTGIYHIASVYSEVADANSPGTNALTACLATARCVGHEKAVTGQSFFDYLDYERTAAKKRGERSLRLNRASSFFFF